MGKRKAGVLLPVSSLPGSHGIGDMGEQAYRFVDILREGGARCWQILPMNPLGYGNSPYQPYSSFAGDPIFINLDTLHAQGLLADAPAPFAGDATRVDYAAVRAYKDGVLHQAFARFTPDDDYEAFAAQPWARAYAVFMAFKRENKGQCWTDWTWAQKDWPARQDIDLSAYAQHIGYELFVQYLFDQQWSRLKRYANESGIHIIGDIPIYVGLDSADVWAGRENFLLDAEGSPTVVAGVPPDYFSKTGQRWGNPLYDWAHMREEGFTFWIDRMRHSARLFDIIRIDHFRAFDTYWEIPAQNPTAEHGEWKEAPGYALFDAVLEALPRLSIIAEDLGMLREEVYVLRDHYHFPGMKILQFDFDPEKTPVPEQGDANLVIYTGTHDNQTMMGWYKSLPFTKRMAARRSLARAGLRGRIFARFLRLAMRDAADLAILPIADVLGMDDAARINTPGTVGSPNWEWKLRDFTGLAERMRLFAKAARDTGRVSGV